MNNEPEPEILQIAELLTSLIEKRMSKHKPVARDEELTVRQVATIKNVSERTVRSWIEKKIILPHKTPGGGVRIYRSQLEV